MQESSGLVLARCSWPATGFPLSDSVVFFQRQPWSYCAKLARIQFGSGWPCQVWAKRIHFGSKPVCKNHWAHFWPTLWQCPLLAPSVCGPQMVCVCVCMCLCVCVCMCVWTEWTWSMYYAGIFTYQFIPYYASAIHRTRMHASSNPLRTANQVDIANASKLIQIGCNLDLACLLADHPISYCFNSRIPALWLYINTVTMNSEFWREDLAKVEKEPWVFLPCRYFPNQCAKWWLWPFAYSVWAPLATQQVIISVKSIKW